MLTKEERETTIHEFSLMLYLVCKEFKKFSPSEKGLKLIEQADVLIRKHTNPLHALRSSSDTIKTIGRLIADAIELHELKNLSFIESAVRLRPGMLQKLMEDDFYTNSVPVMIFKNLLLSLHIPFTDVEKAMIPTFRLLVSKETPDTISKKPRHYELWENEEAVTKYLNKLRELMTKALNP